MRQRVTFVLAIWGVLLACGGQAPGEAVVEVDLPGEQRAPSSALEPAAEPEEGVSQQEAEAPMVLLDEAEPLASGVAPDPNPESQSKPGPPRVSEMPAEPTELRTNEAVGSSAGEPREPSAADSKPGETVTRAWGEALGRFAKAGGLDYAALKADSAALDAFVDFVAEANEEGWTREEHLAFLINAYNAWVARAVLDRYPGLVSVIKEDGFFDQQTFPVAGRQLTLNELERKALDLGEPRVHFAVVCASTGCPDLRPELFEASQLETQLQEQTDRFLADETKGLRYDRAANKLWLSSIFDWYSKDFGGDSVAWVAARLPPDQARRIEANDPDLQFLDYDWSPNDRK